MIELLGIERRYGKRSALRGVNLKVEAGEYLGVVGPSGAGKSTLLAILGLLERPSGGTYSLAGRGVGRLGDREASRLRRDTFGFVFQDFLFFPGRTLLENVAAPLRLAGARARPAHERALACLEAVGLADRRGEDPRLLSGGEQQRAGIARALVRDPPILLADEPTGSLPQEDWRPVLDWMERQGGPRRTLIVVSHDPYVIARAGRRVELRDGCLVE